MTNIQYSYEGNDTIRIVKNCNFFSGFEVSKKERKCLGIKMCEFASKELDVSYTSIDFILSIFKNTFNRIPKYIYRGQMTFEFFTKCCMQRYFIRSVCKISI